MEPLTQRRVSGLINELDITGIVNARLVNFGRYGRTKKIRLGVSTSIIISAFSDDSLIEKILSYSSSFLKNSLKSGS
jgi:cell division control protein 6